MSRLKLKTKWKKSGIGSWFNATYTTLWVGRPLDIWYPKNSPMDIWHSKITTSSTPLQINTKHPRYLHMLKVTGWNYKRATMGYVEWLISGKEL
jgi:hypothetical protein